MLLLCCYNDDFPFFTNHEKILDYKVLRSEEGLYVTVHANDYLGKKKVQANLPI